MNFRGILQVHHGNIYNLYILQSDELLNFIQILTENIMSETSNNGKRLLSAISSESCIIKYKVRFDIKFSYLERQNNFLHKQKSITEKYLEEHN